MARDLTLSIDVGTGSVRAALVDGAGEILHIASREHDQIVPALRLGGAAAAGLVGRRRPRRSATRSRAVEDARERIAAICACGQMHGTVLVDAAGRLTRETRAAVERQAHRRPRRRVRARARRLGLSRRERQPADPGLARLQAAWLRDNDPEAYRRARAVLMPKDYINLRLTGEIAMDSGDASCSFLMNPASARAGRAAMIDAPRPRRRQAAADPRAARDSRRRHGRGGARDRPARGHAGAGRRRRLSGGAARLRRLPPRPRLRRHRHVLHPDA